MTSLFGEDKVLFKPRPSDYFVVGNPDVPQVPNPEPFSLVPQNNPYRAVINAQTRMLFSGQPIPEPDKPGAGQLLFKALEVMDKPRNALFTGIKYATDKDPSTGFLSGLSKGFKGEVKTLGSDFIPETAPKAIRAIAGFGLDVVGDPISWGTGGAAKLGQTALFSGAKAAAKSVTTANKLRAALGVAEKAPVNPEMVQTWVQSLDESLRSLGKGMSGMKIAATQSRRHFLPGFKGEVDTAKLKSLQKFITEDLAEAKVDPYIGAALFDKLKVTGRVDRAAILKSLYRDSTKVASLLDSTNGLDDIRFLDAVRDVATKSGKEKLERVYLSLESKLPETLLGLDPKQKALAGQLVDLFGIDSGLDVATAAGRLGVNLSKKSGAGEGIGKLIGNVERLGEAKAKLSGAKAELDLGRGLAAEFEQETGRYFLKYMGKPIVDVAPVKDFVFDKALIPAYNKVPLVKGIVDTWGMLFLPHYLKWSDAFKKVVGPSLRKFENKLTKAIQMENALPTLTVRSAITTLGREFVEQPKLNQALGYYIEYGWSKNLMPELEKAVAAGTKGAEFELSAAKEAIEYWETKLLPKLTGQELETLERGARAYKEQAKVLYQIDKQIGRKYDPLEDYFHHLYKQDDKVVREGYKALMTRNRRVRGKLAPGLEGADEERRFMTMAQAKKMGLNPIEDGVTSLAVREFKTMKARTYHEMAQYLKGLPGVISESGKDGFVRVASDFIPTLTGKYIHPEVERHLRRVDYMFFTDVGYDSLMRSVAKVTNLVKAFQVGYNPNFTIRNFLGEGLMNAIAGVGIKAHVTAQQILKQNEDALSKLVVNTAEGNITAAQLLHEFMEDGMWYAGITKGNLAQSFEQLTLEEGQAITGGRRAQVNVLGKTKVGGVPVTLNPQVLREASDYLDRWYRLSHYIDRRIKGYGRAHAAEDVRKFHVDYQDLTPSEKAVWRTIVPYYTYFRKNLPIQLRLLVEQPGYQTGIAKLVNNASHALGDPELSRYATENLALPLYEKENGDIAVLNWNLPIVDLGRVHFSLEGNLREQASSLTPLVRVPFETITNRTLSVDRPIERFEGEKAPLFEHLEDSPKVGAKTKYAAEQFFGSLANVPAATVGRFTSYEREIPDRPEQVPILQSVFPIQRPSTAQQASLYRYRDKLLAAIQAAEAEGKEIFSVRQFSSVNQ